VVGVTDPYCRILGFLDRPEREYTCLNEGKIAALLN
jgi:hypothetical protein